jgi:hypothetical protein
MWNPFRSARERRAAEQKAFLDALQAVVQVVVPMANAIERIAEAEIAKLRLYETTGAPQARAHNDLTESILEIERLQSLKDQGYPVDLSVLDQHRWVLHQPDPFS